MLSDSIPLPSPKIQNVLLIPISKVGTQANVKLPKEKLFPTFSNTPQYFTSPLLICSFQICFTLINSFFKLGNELTKSE